MIPAEVEFPGVRRRLLPERENIINSIMLDDLDLETSVETFDTVGSTKAS